MTIETIMAELMDLAAEVPFGNSDFQNRTVIVNDELTPARAYRHAALRIVNRLHALQEARFNLHKREIEIKILERDKGKEQDDLKRELIDLEIEQHRGQLPYIRKLVSDAVREIESLWPIVASVGKLSRADFEEQEALHFQVKHGRKIEGKTVDLYALIQKNPAKLGKAAKLTSLLADLREELVLMP